MAVCARSSVLEEIPRLRCPIFLPGLWAMLDYDPDRHHASVEILRHFGVPHTIDTVVAHAPSGTVRTTTIEPLLLVAGARLEIDVDRGKKAR